MKHVRIGCGAGFAGDRIEPAVELATDGRLDYLVFECLAERTIGLAQQARVANPDTGFDPLLIERMRAVLPVCMERGVRIVTNMGAANPGAAARAVLDLARSIDVHHITVAAIIGDDVLDLVREGDFQIAETGRSARDLGDSLVSANVYLGAEPIVEALDLGADVVLGGRIADPSLFVGPLCHEFGWHYDDWTALGRATLVGHLLECAGQVTGGYFADTRRKTVNDLARLGFPLADVVEDGTAVITKVPGTGGRVTPATCKEQLLYEIENPARYLTPDVAADFSGVRIGSVGDDAVGVDGACGGPRPDLLKVAVGYRDGFIGEGHISYAGVNAVERGRLALDVVRDRLALTGAELTEIRCDLVGVDALHGRQLSSKQTPYEVRARVVAHARTANEAARVGREVEALYTNGPSGGGGVTKFVREVLTVGSTYIPRDRVRCRVHLEQV